MAQYKLHAYDADVYIPEFKGLYQYGDQMGSDLRFSPDCLNVETPGGVLQPFFGFGDGTLIYNSNGDALLEKAWYIASAKMKNIYNENKLGSKVKLSSELETQLTVNAGDEYTAYLIFQHVGAINDTVYEIIIPDGNNATDFEGIYANEISISRGLSHWCVYEKTYTDNSNTPGVPSGTTNVIVASSNFGKAYIYTGFSNLQQIQSSPSSMSHMALYAERIWGCGSALGGNKDRLYYSKPYNAEDWSPPGEGDDPSEFGGEIREATFDEDEICALVPLADSLIAFSKLRAWKITGTDPSIFYIQEQYGNGTPYPNSIAVVDDRIIMVGKDGLLSYDGSRVYPIMFEEAKDVFSNIRKGTTVNAFSFDHKYIVSLYYSWRYSNLVIYDCIDNTITISETPRIMDYYNAYPNAGVLAASMNTSSGIQQIAFFPLGFDSFKQKHITRNATKWTTPWIDLGRKDIQKGGFELYFYPELNTDDPTDSVTLKFSIQTEKKTKTKNYVVHALTDDERTAGKKYRQKRLHFGGTGRRFRLTIETEAGNTVPWRLIGGVHIISEIDKD